MADRGTRKRKNRPRTRPKKKTIKWIVADDWQAIYIDGKLWSEGHHIHPIDLARIFGVERKRVNDNWMSDKGNFPKELADIPEEAYDE
jgi:hypothetical protein